MKGETVKSICHVIERHIPSLIIQEYPHTKGFSFYSKRGCWGNEGTVLFLTEPNSPETILWGQWDPSLPSYIIPTNSQVPGTGVLNLHLPEVSPWADTQLTQHTGNRVESLCGAGKILMLVLPGNSFPFFRQEENRMSSGCIQGHICCKDKWTIMFLGRVSVDLGQRILILWGLLWLWVDTAHFHSTFLQTVPQRARSLMDHYILTRFEFFFLPIYKEQVNMRTYHLKNTAASLSKIQWV